MKKRTVSKISLIVLEALSFIMLLVVLVYGIPYLYDGFTARFTVLKQFFQAITNATSGWFSVSGYPRLAGLVLLVIVLVILQLLTIIPIVSLKKSKEKIPENAKDLETMVGGEGKYISSFVDEKGNYGHVLVDGKEVDNIEKYYTGLTEEQANQEFDWHNYVGGKPKARIITGIVLAVFGLVFLIFRALYYVRVNPKVSNLFNNSLSDAIFGRMDKVQDYLFGGFTGKLFSFGGINVTTGIVLDFIFWVIVVCFLIVLVLVIISFFVWAFRKPIAQKRALRARNAYYLNLATLNFQGEFNKDSEFVIAGVRPTEDLIGESEESKNLEKAAISTIDISKVGTGVSEIKVSQVNVEGNIIHKTASEYTLVNLNDDILLINPSYLSSIAKFERREDNLVQPSEEEALQLSRRPSDEEPSYWFADGGEKKAPAEENKEERRPSDEEPSYWYKAHEKEFEVNDEQAQKNYHSAIQAFKNAIEPNTLRAVEENVQPSDRNTSYWYNSAINDTIQQHEEVKEQENVNASVGIDEHLYPSDRTPSYWYANAFNKVFAEEIKEREANRPSGYAYCGTGEDNYIQTLPGSVLSNAHGNVLVNERGEVITEEDLRRLEQIEPSQLQALEEIEEEKVVKEEVLEEFISQSPVAGDPFANLYSEEYEQDRPSSKVTSYWFDNAKQSQLKTENKPNVIRVAAKHVDIKPNDNVIRIQPTAIRPVAPMQAEEEPVEEVKESEIKGPVGILHAKQQPVGVKISPVAARKVRFQLKTVSSSYQGELTPEEAFNKAVTNQSVVVAPVYVNSGKKTRTKYTDKLQKESDAETRRTGYMSSSAQVVSDLSDTSSLNESGTKFDKPVSAYKSIREWNKAKKEWEKQQANKKEEVKAEKVNEPIKPIKVVKPAKQEEKVEEKKEEVKPRFVFEPIKHVEKTNSSGISKPTKPKEPIKTNNYANKKKGE